MTEEQYEFENGYLNNNYLTMARICSAEWKKFEKKEVWGKGYTGFQEIAIHNAFRDGFMAGFEGRYFNTGDV